MSARHPLKTEAAPPMMPYIIATVLPRFWSRSKSSKSKDLATTDKLIGKILTSARTQTWMRIKGHKTKNKRHDN
eukprot:CAMPEP_0115170532 /NCGR_PEP_ID=MMETSP0270-20121206/1834_1 /TAXON_ID=71861 /ORGANISM="Scrippsiella trochoidea, Strain CCMP3099" /LENGTH=73 /DNA_ID=CAMNT_0002583267 /DNA_START=330 /DNA_END=548 /DNA_ORIENTATION=-